MPNENEIALEAILENQDEKISETNDLLEKILEVTADNNTENLLDKQLELQNETLEATKKIANSKISIEINGDNTTTYRGAKGEKGDEPSNERLIEIIKPLIPEVSNGKDGKDADEEAITDRVLEIVLPEIPTVEEIVALIPVPTNGINGRDGKDGLDAEDIDQEKIIGAVVNRIEIPEIPKPYSAKEIKEKLLEVGLKFDELKEKPDLEALMQRVNQASKTVSFKELDDVSLTSPTNGQVPIYNSTTGKWENGTSGGGAVDSVNSQTGVVVLDADDIDDTSTAHKFVAAGDVTKLGNLSGTNTGDNATNTQYSGLAASKENTITGGTTAQYWRGDKTFQTLDKTAVGLGNVDNTSDANKPVSTAQQTALDLKANLASPTFTGTPAAPTAAPGTNTTQIATTAFVIANATSGYTLPMQAAQLGTVVDATTYYGGAVASAQMQTTAAQLITYIPKDGTITQARIIWRSPSTVPTDEDISIYIRLNNTTDTLIATVGNTNLTKYFYNTSLSISVTTSDYIELKIVCPTWVTNPASVSLGGYIFVV